MFINSRMIKQVVEYLSNGRAVKMYQLHVIKVDEL